MRKQFLRLGSILGMLAVALGAFASHSLKGMLNAEALATFEIGVRYQFYHALALLVVGVLSYVRKTKYLDVAGWLFFFGTLFFSGSLYLLSFKDIAFQFPTRVIGPITPFGGTLFIAGWFFLLLSSFQSVERNSRS